MGRAKRTITSDRGGVLDARIEVKLPPGWHDIRLSIEGYDAVDAQVFVVADDVEFGLVSDIDDTVMVTALPRPFLAAWNTFVLDEHARTPVAGMAVLYERLRARAPGPPGDLPVDRRVERRPDAEPLPVAQPVPARRAAADRLGSDARPLVPQRTAITSARSLERLAAEFPRVRWLLVGDDGQHDPQLYGEFAEAHPDNVAAVAIRQLTTGQAVLAGGRSEPGAARRRRSRGATRPTAPG